MVKSSTNTSILQLCLVVTGARTTSKTSPVTGLIITALIKDNLYTERLIYTGIGLWSVYLTPVPPSCLCRDMIATGCEDKNVRVYYLATSSDQPLKVFTGHLAKVFHVRWSPLREGILCSGSDDGSGPSHRPRCVHNVYTIHTQTQTVSGKTLVIQTDRAETSWRK